MIDINIDMGSNEAEGAIQYMARKMNDVSDLDQINGMKTVSQTYEKMYAEQEKQSHIINKPIIPTEKKNAQTTNATTEGFFTGPGLTEFSNFDN